jgi:ADP-heptose:LPS heptosyltransferase
MSFKPQILIIRQLALGDVILTTPIIEQIAHDYDGHCDIDVLTLKPEVFKGNPFVRKVYTPLTYKEIDQVYDKTINLDLAYEKQPLMHITDAYALYALGSPQRLKNKRPQLYSTMTDKIKVKWLHQTRIESDYLVLHMRRDTWPSRNLPESFWLAIVDTLLKQTSYKIVQVGSAQEFSFHHDDRLIDFRDQLSIHELKELIANAKLYVGIDSGTLHVAATTDTPIISLFSSAHHSVRQPLDRPPQARFIPIAPHVPCYGCQSQAQPPITGVICPQGDPFNPPCIHQFSIDDVSQAIQRLVKHESTSAAHIDQSPNWLTLGINAFNEGQTTKSIELLEKAVHENPEGRDEHIYLGYALCRSGDYARGLDHFDWTWYPAFKNQKDLFTPETQLHGQRILLSADAGLGDAIMLSRYAPLVKACGAHVSLQVPPGLVRLFENSDLADEIVSNATALPAHDLRIPMHNLMNAFSIKPPAQTFAANPYLKALPHDIASFKKKLAKVKKRKVGVCWRGNPKVPIDGLRTVSPHVLLNLCLEDDYLVSLMPEPVDAAEREIHQFELDDIAKTAALITNLDVVLTVDTMVGHLAAALGKPVFILARNGGCWRWGDDNTHSFWYPNVTLLRQAPQESWEQMSQRLKDTDIWTIASTGQLIAA